MTRPGRPPILETLRLPCRVAYGLEARAIPLPRLGYSTLAFSIRSAICSSILAETSSYAFWRRRTAYGTSNPGNCARYFQDAMRSTKSVRNCGCHWRMYRRNSRFIRRERPNSKRTASARALAWSNCALIFSRRAKAFCHRFPHVRRCWLSSKLSKRPKARDE